MLKCYINFARRNIVIFSRIFAEQGNLSHAQDVSCYKRTVIRTVVLLKVYGRDHLRTMKCFTVHLLFTRLPTTEYINYYVFNPLIMIKMYMFPQLTTIWKINVKMFPDDKMMYFLQASMQEAPSSYPNA